MSRTDYAIACGQHRVAFVLLLSLTICSSCGRQLAGSDITGGITGPPRASDSKSGKPLQRAPDQILAVVLLLTKARGPGKRDCLQYARTAIRTLERYIFPDTPSKL